MVDATFADFVRGIAFELITPEVPRGSDRRITIERERGGKATVLELPAVPVDIANTRLGPEARDLHRTLRPVLDMPRMASLAIGAILNRGTASLKDDEAYLNVGVWNGFSLLAGLHRNPGKRCIGIDNFSQFGSPREAFMARFTEYRGPGHEFFDMDYEEYLSTRHEGPIGLYFYDGDHAYEHQLRGLQVAEPFFSDDCMVLVDDANWPEPYDATYDFIARSEREYEIVIDARTASGEHPTWWNGLIVFRATGRRRGGPPPAPSPPPRFPTPLEPNVADFDSRSTLVSVIVCDAQEGGRAVEALVERALAQTWPSVEVLIAGPAPQAARFDERVSIVTDQDAVRAAFEASSGAFVALVDASESELHEASVERALAFPELVLFNYLRAVPRPRIKRLEQAYEATAYIREAIPADSPFVLAGPRELTPMMIDLPRAIPLFVRGRGVAMLDGPGSIARLERFRGDGISFAVFLVGDYSWLERNPEVEQHLRETARPVLENDRVQIFALD
jgi:Methyltransferase domain